MIETMILLTLFKMAKNDWDKRSVYSLDLFSLFLIIILFTETIYIDPLKIFFQILLYQAVKKKSLGEADFIVLMLLGLQLNARQFALLIALSSTLGLLYTAVFKKENKIPFITCLFFAYLLCRLSSIKFNYLLIISPTFFKIILLS